MSGVSAGCDRLIEALDAQLARRGPGDKVGPEAIGIAILCSMSCAYYCEVALKTLQASRSLDGTCTHGHDLLVLYDEIASEWPEQDLERLVLESIETIRPVLPPSWIPSSIRPALEQGKDNFTEWRYNYIEEEKMSGGIPKALYVIACGVEVAVLRRYPELRK